MLALLRLAVTPQPKVWMLAPNWPLGFVSPKQLAVPYPCMSIIAAVFAACLILVELRTLTLLFPDPATPDVEELFPDPLTPLVLDDDELPEPVTPATDEPPVAVLVDPLVAVVSPMLPPVAEPPRPTPP